jgi:cell division septum initiation protein DivIVA
MRGFMSSSITDRDKWEEFVKRSEGLMEEYEKLLKRVKELESAKTSLQERLVASEAQREELQQKLSLIVNVILRELAPLEEHTVTDAKWVGEIKELRTSIDRLLKHSET